MRKKRFKFAKKTLKWLYYFTEAFIALIIVLGGLMFWKLYTQPMDANFLLPEVSKRLLPRGTQYTIEVDSSLLYAMPNKKGIFHLNIKNLNILRPDKTPVLVLPEVNLSYGLWHLLTLNYLPDQLEILKPSFHMTISDQGTFISQDSAATISNTTSGTINFNTILNHILSFDQLHVINGQVQLDDLTAQRSLAIPRFSLHLRKDFGFLHKASLFGIVRIQDKLLDFQTHASLSKLSHELSLELNLPKFNPVVFDKFFPILGGVDIPLSLIAKGQFNVKKKHKNLADGLSKLKFQLKALKPGTLRLPHPIQNTYSIKSMEINGGAADAFQVFKIAQSPFTLTNGVSADLNLSVKGLNQFFHSWDPNDLATVLEANVRNVTMQDVPKVWPAEQGPSAHQWVKEHLSVGKVTDAYFKLTFDGSNLTDVFGDLHTQNVRVDYLPPMPAIDAVSAQVLLYPKEVRILANSGHIKDVSLVSADLIFHDVDTDNSWTEMTIDASGSAQQTLDIIESPPLQLMQVFDVPYTRISGKSKTHLYLRFPLLDDLHADKIHVQVQAQLTDASYQTDIPNFVVNNGEFQLDVTNAGLKLDGHILVQKENLQLQWLEDFSADSDVPTRYAIQTALDAKELTPLIPDLEKYIEGKIGLKATLEQTKNKTWQGSIMADLADAKVVLYPVSRTKPTKQPANLDLHFSKLTPDLQKGAVTFSLIGTINKEQDLNITGSGSWDDGIMLTLDKVIAAGNQFSGKIQNTPSVFHATLQGTQWDISNLFDMPLFQQSSDAEAIQPQTVPDLDFQIDLDQLILNSEHPLTDLQFHAQRKGKLWDNFHLQAKASEPFILVYEPKAHKFQGSFGDFGALLKYLSGQDRFKEGIISLEAQQKKDGMIQGHISVDKITIREPGFFMQAATILGIVDAFRDKDLTLDTVHVPFSIDPWHTIQLQDAYAAGSTLGVTFNGTITAKALDLAGSVIPAYAINSLPGKIPLVGALFRSEEGGGLIGVKYNVDGSLLDPIVHFHPLSTVLPGALGRVF